MTVKASWRPTDGSLVNRDRSKPIAVFYGAASQRVAGTLAFACFSIIFTLQAFSPGKGGVALVLLHAAGAVATAILSFRSFGCGTLIARSDTVELRGAFRTTRWGWSEIASWQTGIRLVGIMRYRRSVLALELTSGEVRWLNEMNVRPARAGEASSMEVAARSLNELLWGKRLDSSDAR